ncbi:MAG: hypothetical protein WA366_16145, partial [Pseudolabrys sp.]
MRRTIAIAAVTALFLVGLVVIAAPGNRVISTKVTDNSRQTTMPIYNLHVGHHNMKNLPVQQ